MPQLMPLSWIFSVIVMFLVIISSCVMYSEKAGNSMFKDSSNNINEMNLGVWCW